MTDFRTQRTQEYKDWAWRKFHRHQNMRERPRMILLGRLLPADRVPVTPLVKINDKWVIGSSF